VGAAADDDVSESDRRRLRWSARPKTALAVFARAETGLTVSAWVTVGVAGSRRRQERGSGSWPGRPTALPVVGGAGEGVLCIGGGGEKVVVVGGGDGRR